jgi:HSP20 family protein
MINTRSNGRGAGVGFSNERPVGRSGPVLVPPADVVETAPEFLGCLDLSGVRPEAVDVRVEAGRLLVTAERRAPDTHTSGQLRSAERVRGWFERVFELPSSVDVTRVEARHQNGTLTVTLPKIERAQPRIIDVEIAH